MKAAFYEHYGNPTVVTIKELPTPKPKANEIRIKIAATAVTAADSRIRGARFPGGFGFFAKLAFGLTKPRRHVLGSVFSGVVESVGADVTNFSVGEEICGSTGTKMGAHAEYVVVRMNGSIAKKPTSVSHQDAAAMIFGGTAALSFVRDKLHVTTGEHVVVNGASGAVGSNAVQLASYFGARVTGVTSSDNAQLVTSLGASQIIDYTKENLLDRTDTFDVVLDAVGNIRLRDGKKLLTSQGRLGLMVASFGEIIKSLFIPQVKAGVASEKRQEIEFLLSLMEQGELRAVIDKVYPLEDIVSAHKHVDSGKKKGNVLLTL